MEVSADTIPIVRLPTTLDEWWLDLFSGRFSISVAEIAPVVTALAAWLAARNGRKVRIKIGEVEVEARSAEEAEKLLLRVKEFQQDTLSKGGKLEKPKDGS